MSGQSSTDLIDFERYLPAVHGGGRFYLWETHVTDAAQHLGWASPAKVELLQIQLRGVRETTDRVKQLEDELAELRLGLRILFAGGRRTEDPHSDDLLRRRWQG